MAESDQPLSLNERSARILSLLSPPPPSASSPRRSKEFRVRKIKIEGRRRLCKISSETAADDSPIDAKLLDSPPRERPQQHTKWLDSPDGQDGGENIQDILDCLTARLETLSVQKPGPRARTPLPDPEPIVKHETYNFNLFPSPEKKEDFKERVKAKGKAAVDVSSDDDEGSCLVLGGNARKGSSGYPIQKTSDAQPRPKPWVAGNLENRDWSKDGGRDIPFAVREQGVRRPLRDVSPANSVLSENYVAVSCEEDEDGDDAPLPIRMIGTGVCSSRKYELPGKLAKMLYRHQRDGLKWLWSLHCRGTGGILGDDMGLGKTMQVSAFLAGLFHSRLIRRALIVAPKTLLGHWMKELSVVGLAKNTRDYSGPSMKLRQYELQYILKEGGILLTTYDIVRNNSKSISGDWYVHRDQDDEEAIWDYIILDEGHIVKNPKTQRAKSLHDIPSVHRIIISGTPIQNNLKELWALFNFCCPEILGDKDMFKIKYENPIIKGNDKNASDRNKHYGSSVAKELRERIKPYFLRRLKSEVFLENDSTKGETLSKKNEIIVWLKLTPLQRQLYEAFLNSELVHSSVDGSPLAALTILKKICDHPLLLTKKAAEGVLEGMDTMLNHEDRNMVEEMAMNLASRAYKDAFKQVDHTFSCKICFIMILLENLVKEGHTVLIFSQTRKMLDLIQEAIVSAGYKFLRIDGTTKVSDREKIVKDFQGDSGAPIFLLTSQVGGLGLTLTKADRVIVVDPAWNPSTDNQSVDRAYRIGQTKDVLVYRLMTCGTIEEKIYKMQVFKGGLFRTATEHKEQTRYFSQKDIKELFSLPEQGFDVSLTQKQLHEEHDQHHTMEESVVNHIKFLEKQGIAGISHHSLLYSKTATLPFVPAVEVQSNKLGNRIIGSFASSVSVERVTDGAEFAFKPKDQKFIYSALSSRVSPNQTQESPELIEERLKRLSQTLANKALVSKLPDRGARIHKQISELDALLQEIRDSPATQASKKDFGVVDSDGLADEMKRVLSV